MEELAKKISNNNIEVNIKIVDIFWLINKKIREEKNIFITTRSIFNIKW